MPGFCVRRRGHPGLTAAGMWSTWVVHVCACRSCVHECAWTDASFYIAWQSDTPACRQTHTNTRTHNCTHARARACAQVGYYFSNGPWRLLWIRYGYDPRTTPEARMYQLIDYRLKDHSLLAGQPLDSDNAPHGCRPLLILPSPCRLATAGARSLGGDLSRVRARYSTVEVGF